MRQPMNNTDPAISSNGAGPQGPASVPSSNGATNADPIGLAKRSALANAVNSDAIDDRMQKRWPNLYAFMCWREIDERTVKERAKLSVRIDRGGFVASLQDEYLASSLSALGSTFEEALGALNKLLGSPDQHWSPWKGKTPGKRVSKRPEKGA